MLRMKTAWVKLSATLGRHERAKLVRLFRFENQTFLAEDVLAGRGCRRDLGGMVAMGRAQDHGVDVGACGGPRRVPAIEREERRPRTASRLVGLDLKDELDCSSHLKKVKKIQTVSKSFSHVFARGAKLNATSLRRGLRWSVANC